VQYPDIFKVFYSPTDAQVNCLKNNINPLNAELNPICHLLALLGGATIVVVSRLRVKIYIKTAPTCFGDDKPSSGSALFVLAKVTVVKIVNQDTSVLGDVAVYIESATEQCSTHTHTHTHQ
jgi:hypothetical protein